MYSNPIEKQKKSTIKDISSTDEDDECDSSSLIHPIITIRRIKNDIIHRRKASSPKKHSTLILPSRRANTRISRKIIEQDLELLRQANIDQQPLDLSVLPTFDKSDTIEDVLDLSLTR